MTALLLVVLAAPVPKAKEADPALVRLFGTPVDPDGECSFNVAGTSLTISLPAGNRTLTDEHTKRNAPRVLRDAAGDFVAVVRAAATYPDDAVAAPAETDPGSAAGLVLWVDDKNYVCLERCHEQLGRNRVVTSTELHAWVNGEDGGSESGRPLPFDPAAVYLRLERRGKTVRGSASTDGLTWTRAGEVELPAAGKARVGVFAEHNTRRPVTATFDQFTVK